MGRNIHIHPLDDGHKIFYRRETKNESKKKPRLNKGRQNDFRSWFIAEVEHSSPERVRICFCTVPATSLRQSVRYA